MFWRKKPSEEDIQEKYLEQELVNAAMQVDANLQQMRREYGPESYIVKDDTLENIYSNLAIKLKTDENGIPVRDSFGCVIWDGVKSEHYLGVLEYFSPLNATSWIDRSAAEFLIANIHKTKYLRTLAEELREFMTEEDYKKFERMIRLDKETNLEIAFTQSLIDGRRVRTLKTYPHLFRAEILRRKKEKEGKGGGWW